MYFFKIYISLYFTAFCLFSSSSHCCAVHSDMPVLTFVGLQSAPESPDAPEPARRRLTCRPQVNTYIT